MIDVLILVVFSVLSGIFINEKKYDLAFMYLCIVIIKSVDLSWRIVQ